MSTTTTGVEDDEKRFLQTIQSFRSDEETDNDTGPNISSFDVGNSFTAKVLGAVSKFMKTKSNYRIKGLIKDSVDPAPYLCKRVVNILIYPYKLILTCMCPFSYIYIVVQH
jgi:hypothetical protein